MHTLTTKREVTTVKAGKVTIMKKSISALAIITAAALSLSACADPNTTDSQSSPQSSQATPEAGQTFDISTIKEVPEISALVPASVKEKGILKNAVSADFAPAEFFKSDGQTTTGYDVDIIQAVAQVMGLNSVSEHNEFATILPKLGSQYDVAASSFTITEERLQQVNMVSYVNVGSAYAVAKGNPKKFDATNPCGTTIGVLNGSYQQEFIAKLSEEECVAKGKPAINVMPHDLQTEIAPKVAGGQYDATLADSPVIGYTIKQSNDQLEQAGDILEAEAQGIAIALGDKELAGAVQKAVQYLMDNGYLTKILDNYGAGSAALTQAELNPSK